MLNPRILLVLAGLPDGDTLLDMMLAALSHAGRPYGLRFAVPIHWAETIQAAQLPPGALGAGDIRYYEEARGLAAVRTLITDETHFLRLHGLYSFSERWETTLLARYSKIASRKVLMTAAITGAGETAQACLPAITATPDAESVPLGAGVALVCSAAPVKTFLVHPAFVFGPVTFLHEADPELDTLSLSAFAAGFIVYAMDRAPLWPANGTLSPAMLRKPARDEMPSTYLTRFEQMTGIDFQRGTVMIRATQGFFNVEDGYAQQLPLPLVLRQRAQTLLRRAPPPVPLIITAFIDLPDVSRPPQSYTLRFASLRKLTHLPLILYAGGEMERHLRATFPNTLAYPDNSLLPRSLLSEGITPRELFSRNKLLLLDRTRRAYPSYSHVAWLDCDALPHPVCPRAAPDCTALMDDRVHIGWVDGEPDASFLVIPTRLIKLMVREVQSITQLDSVLKRDFSERAMLRRLLDKYPDLFTLHPLPGRELLFLTCLPSTLLAAPLSASLRALDRPIRVPPTLPARKERIPLE